MSRYDQKSETQLEPNLWCWNAGCLEVKPAQLKWPRFSCGKTSWNDLFPRSELDPEPTRDFGTVANTIHHHHHHHRKWPWTECVHICAKSIEDWLRIPLDNSSSRRSALPSIQMSNIPEESKDAIFNSNNNSSFCQKHPGVPDGSDVSDGTSYPLTENYTLPVAQATGPSLLDWCSALQVHLRAPGSTSNHSRAVWENNFFFGNAAGAPWNHSYY